MHKINTRPLKTACLDSAFGKCWIALCRSHSFPVQWNLVWNSLTQYRQNDSGKVSSGQFIFRYFAEHEAHFHVYGSCLLFLFAEILLPEAKRRVQIMEAYKNWQHCDFHISSIVWTVLRPCWAGNLVIY